MAIITEEEVRKVYATAPQHLKDMVNSDEVFNAFHEIRAAYNLHLDHAQNLAMAIDAVILEMKPFSEMGSMLADGLRSVDEATRLKVLKDVDEKIFKPLRELTHKSASPVAKAVADKEPTRPSIQNVEKALKPAPEVPIIQIPVVAQQVVVQALPVALPPTPMPVVQGSVVTQKMTTTVAPPVPTVAVPPPTPPKYHGADPYKESIE